MKGSYLINRVGTGTFQDPFRPAHVMDIGLAWSAVDGGEYFLVEVEATPAQLAQLKLEDGVEEIKKDSIPMNQQAKDRIRNFHANLATLDYETGENFYAAIKSAALARQVENQSSAMASPAMASLKKDPKRG